MAMIVALIVALIAAGIIAVFSFLFLGLPALKKFIRKRKEKKKKIKVSFGDTKKVINENAREILKNAPRITMDDLEKLYEETPYFVVDYDPETDELTSDIEGIKVEEVGGDLEEFFDENAEDGIVLFD